MTAVSEVNLPVRIKVSQPALITSGGDVVPYAEIQAVWIKSVDPGAVEVQGKLNGSPDYFGIITFSNDTIPDPDPRFGGFNLPEPESREVAEAQAQAALDELLELLGWHVEIDYRQV
jgi:hypothetical protein